MDRQDIKMLVNKWWDIYNDENLDYEGPAATEEPNQPILATLSAAGAVKYVTAPSAA